LAKVEGILPEDAVAVSGAIATCFLTLCTHDSPSVSSISTSVPEENPSMTALLKHLKPHKGPASAKMLGSLPIAPPVQTIIVDGVPVINPKLTPIIRDNAEPVMTCLVDSQTSSPTDGEVVTFLETFPFLTCVLVIDNLAPPSHVCLATVEVLATTALTKVEDILSEDTMTINGRFGFFPFGGRAHNNPSVSSVTTLVPEENPCMTSFLKHFKTHTVPPLAKRLGGLPVAPAMQAIVVDGVSIVDPQLAPVIRENAESVFACPRDSQASCPAHGEVIVSGKSGPLGACVFVVHDLPPTIHVGFATIQVLTATALSEVKGLLPEGTTAIRAIATLFHTTRLHNSPSVPGVQTSVPEEHPSMTALLKHLKSHKMPTRLEFPGGFAIAPTMQPIVVDCVLVVDPQLTTIVRDNAETVVATPEDSHTACPTRSKVIGLAKPRPLAACVAIVHHLSPSVQVGFASIQILAPTPLLKVKRLLPEDTTASRHVPDTAVPIFGLVFHFGLEAPLRLANFLFAKSIPFIPAAPSVFFAEGCTRCARVYCSPNLLLLVGHVHLGELVIERTTGPDATGPQSILFACLRLEICLGSASQVATAMPLKTDALLIVCAFLCAGRAAYFALLLIRLICQVHLGNLEASRAFMGELTWCILPGATVPIFSLGFGLRLIAPLCLTNLLFAKGIPFVTLAIAIRVANFCALCTCALVPSDLLSLIGHVHLSELVIFGALSSDATCPERRLLFCFWVEFRLRFTTKVTSSVPFIPQTCFVACTLLCASSIAQLALLLFGLICQVHVGAYKSFGAEIWERFWWFLPNATVPIFALSAGFRLEGVLRLTNLLAKSIPLVAFAITVRVTDGSTLRARVL